MEEYRSGHNEAVLKTVWVKAHGGSNPSSSATKTRQILSGFLLLRKRASCAICDCTRLRRRTPYHGADASLLRVNSPAPLLNESSSSANKTDKPFACPFCLMHYVRGIRTRALRKRHGASFLAAARKRREKQALAFAKIERSGHSQQPDTKCQMQGISAKARLLSVDRRLLRVITLSHH